jgi:amino-acid N-acetyltransferase
MFATPARLARGSVSDWPGTATGYPVAYRAIRSRYPPLVSDTPKRDNLVVRRARTSDVPAIKALVDIYAGKILLEKNLVTLYEAVQEFWVAELDGEILGCGALHVLWADLGEVRTVAAHPKVRGMGVGHAVVAQLLEVARELQLQRVFVLTFEIDFFHRHGFQEIEGTPVTAEVYEEMCRSYDTGVAEFLDLSYVKPNTLGNTRMLVTL